MPQWMPEPSVWVPLTIAALAMAAILILGWVLRSGNPIDNPWVATVVAISIVLLAAALVPFYPILLLIALPLALIALLVYFVLRRAAV